MHDRINPEEIRTYKSLVKGIRLLLSLLTEQAKLTIHYAGFISVL